jgi:hypothetical protein
MSHGSQDTSAQPEHAQANIEPVATPRQDPSESKGEVAPAAAPAKTNPVGRHEKSATLPKGMPFCGQIGTKSEGWYRTKSNAGVAAESEAKPQWIKFAKCAGKSPRCRFQGSIAEGWYVDDDNIARESCAMNTGPASALEFASAPKCDKVGTKSEGWYRAETTELLNWGACQDITPECRSGGAAGPGWYAKTQKIVASLCK